MYADAAFKSSNIFKKGQKEKRLAQNIIVSPLRHFPTCATLVTPHHQPCATTAGAMLT